MNENHTSHLQNMQIEERKNHMRSYSLWAEKKRDGETNADKLDTDTVE